MKAVRHQEDSGGEHRTAQPAGSGGRVLGSRRKHYIVWGILRFALGVVQMTFAIAAILSLIFVGLTPTALGYSAVATIATLVSRVLYRGRREPHQ